MCVVFAVVVVVVVVVVAVMTVVAMMGAASVGASTAGFDPVCGTTIDTGEAGTTDAVPTAPDATAAAPDATAALLGRWAGVPAGVIETGAETGVMVVGRRGANDSPNGIFG